MAATASYRAVPSMLTVAPIGRTSLATLGSTPFFSSRQWKVTGSVAELEEVPQAVIRAWLRLAMNLHRQFKQRVIKSKD